MDSYINTTIEFRTTNDTFSEYSRIFGALSLIDRITYDYVIDTGKVEKSEIRKMTPKVSSTLKYNPLSIGSFTPQEWFNIFIIVTTIVVNYRKFGRNIDAILDDFDEFKLIVIETLDDVLEGFPNFELEMLRDAFGYIKGMSEEELRRFTNRITMFGIKLKDIVRIIIDLYK